jgi:hypothetical protein
VQCTWEHLPLAKKLMHAMPKAAFQGQYHTIIMMILRWRLHRAASTALVQHQQPGCQCLVLRCGHAEPKSLGCSSRFGGGGTRILYHLLYFVTYKASLRVWVVYLTPKIERIISLLSTSPEGEVRCRCQNGMAYKD